MFFLTLEHAQVTLRKRLQLSVVMVRLAAGQRIPTFAASVLAHIRRNYVVRCAYGNKPDTTAELRSPAQSDRTTADAGHEAHTAPSITRQKPKNGSSKPSSSSKSCSCFPSSTMPACRCFSWPRIGTEGSTFGLAWFGPPSFRTPLLQELHASAIGLGAVQKQVLDQDGLRLPDPVGSSLPARASPMGCPRNLSGCGSKPRKPLVNIKIGGKQVDLHPPQHGIAIGPLQPMAIFAHLAQGPHPPLPRQPLNWPRIGGSSLAPKPSQRRRWLLPPSASGLLPTP